MAYNLAAAAAAATAADLWPLRARGLKTTRRRKGQLLSRDNPKDRKQFSYILPKKDVNCREERSQSPKKDMLVIH